MENFKFINVINFKYAMALNDQCFSFRLEPFAFSHSYSFNSKLYQISFSILYYFSQSTLFSVLFLFCVLIFHIPH